MSSIVNSDSALQDASKTAIAWAAKAEEQMGWEPESCYALARDE